MIRDSKGNMMTIEFVKEFIFSFVLMLSLILAVGLLFFSVTEPEFKGNFASRILAAIHCWRKTWFGR